MGLRWQEQPAASPPAAAHQYPAGARVGYVVAAESSGRLCQWGTIVGAPIVEPGGSLWWLPVQPAHAPGEDTPVLVPERDIVDVQP